MKILSSHPLLLSSDKAELYLPELYNKIGVGLMAWSPGLLEGNVDRFAISKGSFTKKSQSYSSWTEDEANKEVGLIILTYFLGLKINLFSF